MSSTYLNLWLRYNYFRFGKTNVRHIGIILPVSISTISPQPACHSVPVCEILPKSDMQKMTSYRFSRWRISAILDFRGSITGSLKSPCTISYRSSVETISSKLLNFRENPRFCILATDRLRDIQRNRWTGPSHEAALVVASGGFTSKNTIERLRCSKLFHKFTFLIQ